MKAITLAISAALLLSEAPNVQAFVTCGYHDRSLTLTAYHWNSEFWVDMLVSEANRWNRVHSALTINRLRSSSVPVGNDGRSVVSWISESDLNRAYGLSWSGTVGWTISWYDCGNCSKLVEADVFFNPSISLFAAQTRVPYNLGYQEIALHELGHVLTHDHEDRTLAVMTAGQAVSDVLYTSDKVGWLRSADTKFSVTDRMDMGIFPLRNNGANKIYSTVSPAVVTRGNNVTIQDFTVQNLSSARTQANALFKVFLQPGTGATREIGGFFWASFGPYSEWSGNLTFRIPSNVIAATYRVVGVYQNLDADSSNDQADFGSLQVR